MPSPESESSIPLPGVQQQTFRSSPPSFDYPSPTKDMENNQPMYKTDPAGTNPESNTRLLATQAISSETERPPSAQRVNADVNESLDPDEEEELEEDPAEKISDFNWDDLHERYHSAIDRASDEEAALMLEWSELMEYFKIWAEAGHSHETDRTFSRLRTRMAYVQNSEDKQEKSREHYISVVQAFESALTLLRGSGFRG